MIVIRLRDCIRNRYCKKGVRRFLLRQGLSYDAFLKNGMTEEQALALNDAMATRLVGLIRKEQDG
jgi:hypothetical protein